MRQYARVHIARTQIQECGEEAEQRGVCELEQRSQRSHQHGYLWMRDMELVEVVDVGDAEVQRGEEDNLLFSEVREQVQRNHE